MNANDSTIDSSETAGAGIPQLPELPDLAIELRKLLRQLPSGRVTTYGQLAKALGSMTAAKWVAGYLIAQPSTDEFPAHRVVRADGELGNYASRSAADQTVALEADGISVEKGRVDLSRHGFDSFQSNPPLARLITWQMELAARVSLVVPPHVASGMRVIGGVDVSYQNPELAIAGYALTDLETGELIWSRTREEPLKFPYISGFLGFRELPALVPLIEEVRQAGRLADVLIVDGNGTLHPRGIGVASHLGVVTGLPTIGVSKTLSFGHVDLENMQPGETRPITSEGRLVGMALRPKHGSHPLFVSPGHLMDLPTATQLAVQACHSHRLPDPQYWADRLSREIANRE